jgi:uncharacterized membrane-anchored protein
MSMLMTASRVRNWPAMRLLTNLRRARSSEPGVVAGPVRVDRRTKRLAGRLRPGDIAVIDHLDLDRVAAESLVAAQVAAVLNARPSISGRYPNLGPELLVAAGIPLVDDLGEEILQAVRDGDVVTVEDNTILVGGAEVAYGVRQDTDSVAKAMAAAREGLSVQLEAFASNTMTYLRQERELLLDGVGVPEVATHLAGRHCLIVVRGYGHQDDLRALRPYIRDVGPILIGVDGGADALAAAGYRPDLIVGDMDSVSDEVLRCGAELVVHAYPDGRAPGMGRLTRLDLPAILFPAAATSEDIAMLLADGNGAELIVVVGGHATLGEFLDKGRGGMASTFLTRLKVGGKLVDAKGVSRLYRRGAPITGPILLVVASLAAMAAALLFASVWRGALDHAAGGWDAAMVWLRGRLT